MISVPMTVIADNVPVQMNVSEDGTLNMAVSAGYSAGEEPYTGEYVFTPGDEETVAQTKRKYLSEDIVIRKVPSNYGRIGWNGSVLTVS